MSHPTRPPLLITCALPYANGSLHLGSLVGYIQADIWHRFHKSQGRQSTYVCGSDAHGTPIMINAEKNHMTPEALVTQFHEDHQEDFRAFGVVFDNFHTTHSEENKDLSALIYNRLQEKGDIVSRIIEQAFDPEKKMFLPDRYVKGTCPRCKAPDQYGDSCESCGATYHPTDLIDPRSVLSGAVPIQKKSEHYFFQLKNYTDSLLQWTQQGHLQPQVTNKLKEWFEMGLYDWDISRDEPYFGFTIPGTTDKYFYVWLDAPIGYMASFKQLCQSRDDLNFDDYWEKDSNTELYHFIGKDIIYFHSLFWPAMLQGAGFRTPTAISAHGFLTINGEKMSKSRGTFIKARTYLNHLPPEMLRYYFATKLGNNLDDLDLNLEDFIQRINSDVVGKVVNIASRTATFINKHFNNQLSTLHDEKLYDHCVAQGDVIAAHYEDRDFNRAVRVIMELADTINQYINDMKPWQRIKEGENADTTQAICTTALNGFRLLMVYLHPILPAMAQSAETFLQTSLSDWHSNKTPLLNHTIEAFSPLAQRIDKQAVSDLQAEAAREAKVS